MEQNLKNHTRLVAGYHGIVLILIVSGLIGAFINLANTTNTANLYSASLITLLFIIGLGFFWYIRQFALKAQDRAIRAEENLRYFALTGKLLPKEIKMGQVISLRFASDAEFVALVAKTIAENLSPSAIKQVITNWKPDYNRL